MLHAGVNEVDGISVEVIRKRLRRISLRIDEVGAVRLSVPVWSTLKEGEAFLKAKWKWVLKTRLKVLSQPKATYQPATEEDIASLQTVIKGLFTHFAVHGHGPKFYALMDARLPGWQQLRKQLKDHAWGRSSEALQERAEKAPSSSATERFVQMRLPGFQ